MWIWNPRYRWQAGTASRVDPSFLLQLGFKYVWQSTVAQRTHSPSPSYPVRSRFCFWWVKSPSRYVTYSHFFSAFCFRFQKSKPSTSPSWSWCPSPYSSWSSGSTSSSALAYYPSLSRAAVRAVSPVSFAFPSWKAVSDRVLRSSPIPIIHIQEEPALGPDHGMETAVTRQKPSREDSDATEVYARLSQIEQLHHSLSDVNFAHVSS